MHFLLLNYLYLFIYFHISCMHSFIIEYGYFWYSMATSDAYLIKYHHGGRLLRGENVTYVNGSVNEFAVDPDKICYWDLLGDVKELGYDIEKCVTMSCVDDGGKLLPMLDEITLC